MDNITLSELIGLIYDVASDVDLWPRLLEILSNEMELLLAEETTERPVDTLPNCRDSNNESNLTVSQPNKNNAITSDSNELKGISISDYALIDLLRIHFIRAIKLNRQIFEAREERNAMEEVLERLPLGMLIVDSESRVLAYNHKLNQIMSEGKGISVRNGMLTTVSSIDTARLKKLIRAAANGDEQEARAVNLAHLDSAVPLSILVIPLRAETSSYGIYSNKVVVLVATPELHIEIPKETLMSLYKLTAAEARLVSSLVRGRNLNSISEEFNISKNTLRTQLKSVYEKTRTHRQAELVRQVVTGPAMLSTLSSKEGSAIRLLTSSNKPNRNVKTESRLDQVMRLPDRRLLGYAEYGVSNGVPVILMHSLSGCRLERHPDETITERCGVRLIIPDRPGVGLSDSNQNMTLQDWAKDVNCLADHLRLKLFNVIGLAGGCAFALACAYRLGERIKRLVLVSSIAPFTSVWDLGGMIAPFRLLLSMGKYTPSLLGPLFRLMGIQNKPELVYNEISKYIPPAERVLSNDAAMKNLIDEILRENLRQGDHHVLLDVLLLSQDWGFELSDVPVPVELWHGELDRFVPLQMASRMAETLPDCRTNFVPDAGHYLFMYNWEKILKAAALMQ